MKLEEQVTNRELSKKLKELGVKQESLFTWKQWVYPEGEWKLELYQPPAIYKAYRYISAFTVAELGEMLPAKIYKNKTLLLTISKETPPNKNFWYCCYLPNEKTSNEIFEDGREANARAKMLIYLIENKLMEGKG